VLEDCLFFTPCLPVAGGCWFVFCGVKEKLTICQPAAVLRADGGDNLPAPETVSTQSSCGGLQPIFFTASAPDEDLKLSSQYFWLAVLNSNTIYRRPPSCFK
jgi:hypothetical protein